MKIIELFSGIGAWAKAFKRLDIDHEVVSAIEIDAKTMKSYNIIHGTTFKSQDIQEVDPTGLPDCDIVCYSPPCQTWSKAGKNKGFNDHRGILFFNALDIIKTKKPKYAIMENVGNLSQKFSFEFSEMLKELEDAGYNNYWQIMNAYDYDIPHSRERVFVVSIRSDINQSFTFPEKRRLTKAFSDYLVKDVDPIYHHSQKGIEYMNRRVKDGRNHWDFNHHNDTDRKISHCIVSNFFKGVPYNVLIDRRGPTTIIRRHTPIECFRLLGFDDHDCQLLIDNKISHTQLYKMIGNSIVVNVVEEILIKLIGKVESK